MNMETVQVPTWSPPAWMNATVRGMLRTPGIERWLGKGIALLTITGKKTGKLYRIPVSYHREGDAVTILTKKFRRWWRNLEAKPDVEIRLAGRTYPGKASARSGDERDLPTLIDFLESRPMDARAYGISLSPEGEVSAGMARALLNQIVVVRVALAREA
jgi:deazaflavin-dependent oxidoreductase (nitroreductase family)